MSLIPYKRKPKGSISKVNKKSRRKTRIDESSTTFKILGVLYYSRESILNWTLLKEGIARLSSRYGLDLTTTDRMGNFGIRNDTFNGALKRLIKRKEIKKVDRGLYQIDQHGIELYQRLLIERDLTIEDDNNRRTAEFVQNYSAMIYEIELGKKFETSW